MRRYCSLANETEHIRYGPIEACDLHVGCKLKVFGRNVTLRQARSLFYVLSHKDALITFFQADSATARWLEAEALRLTAVQNGLVQELSRLNIIVRSLPSGKSCSGIDNGRVHPSRDIKMKGGESLRLILLDIAYLKDRLRQEQQGRTEETVANQKPDVFLAMNLPAS